MKREAFEQGFHSRTLAYQPGFRTDSRPVVVAVGSEAHSTPGHVLLLGLVNLLARAHQHIVVVGDLNGDLMCRDPFHHRRLETAVLGLASGINPFIEVDVARTAPRTEPLISIGIAAPADVRVGCEGWTALFGETVEVGREATSMPGAILAACLGAATAFHRQLGVPAVPTGPYSLWEYVRNSRGQGPAVEGPIDVGRTLQVGVGAVGAAVDYWMAFLGLVGPWTLVDGDKVDVTNLNRQLYFLAVDAGWPDGDAVNKATAVAERLGNGATASPHHYGLDQQVVDAEYDVVLALANEGGVRPALQSRPEPVLLHATTTPTWTATSHPHIAALADCIVCRLPDEEDPTFKCSTGFIGPRRRNDASLPFLAGVAGAMLLRDLIALQHECLHERPTNFAAVDLREPAPFTRELKWQCREGCRARLPRHLRRSLAVGNRYIHLDS